MVVPPRITSTSAEALFRYQVVAHVEASIYRGKKQLEAVRAAASQTWPRFDGTLVRVGKRTIYRWLAAYREHGLAGLERSRPERLRGSAVVSDELLGFVADQKQLDPAVSIPEVIRRARELGIVDAAARIDRSTLYRAAKRMEIPVVRRKGPIERDARRFAYPHRLDCVLCDGKHFRAGALRQKRVALFFIDDATRMGLGVVVGTSETPALFLRGLYELSRRHGLMQIVYLGVSRGTWENRALQPDGQSAGPARPGPAPRCRSGLRRARASARPLPFRAL